MSTDLVRWLRKVADPIDQQLIAVAFGADQALDGEQGCCHSAGQMEQGACGYVNPDLNPGVRIIASRYADREGYREEWKPEAKR